MLDNRVMRSHGLRICRHLVALAVVLGGLSLTTAVASAAFPGRNGLLVLAAPCAHSAPGCHGLEVVRPDGRGLRLLCPRVAACREAGAPEFSPDGRRVAFASSSPPQGEMTIVYADGSCSQCQAAGYGSASPGFSAGTSARPAWKPNGRQLAEPSEYGVQLVGDDGLLEQLGLALGPGSADDFAVSRSDVLAFAQITKPHRRDLFLLATGGRPRRLTRTGGDQPSWSPGCRSLAFVRAGDTYVIGANGVHARLLVRDGVNPAFSPDGRYVAFVRRRPHRPGSVFVVPAGGGRARQVPGASADALDWQPLVPPATHGCTLNAGARVVAQQGSAIVATRIATTNEIPYAQVWVACRSPLSHPRVLWIAGGDGDYIPLDGLFSFVISGRWVAFEVSRSNGDHEGPPGGRLSIEAFNTDTGQTPVSPASFVSRTPPISPKSISSSSTPPGTWRGSRWSRRCPGPTSP